MKSPLLNVCHFFCLTGMIFVLFISPVSAQRQMEELDRGLLAVKVSSGVFLSWRVLGPEWNGVTYNLYRGTEKLNTDPISGATNFLDESGTLDSEYHVHAIVNDIEQISSDTVKPWEANYFDLPVRDIAGDYELNDASVGDLDGDGEYEIIVKRISPDLSEDPQYTHLIEAYQLDGTHIWTIDLGPNRPGAKQVNFIVYDLDGDGKAEVVTKTSEGTIDGTGVKIGDVNNDGITNYRYSIYSEDVSQGPEFLSFYEGSTGKEIARTDYIGRDPLVQWGLPSHNMTQLVHRAHSTMMSVIYADGKTPTLVMCRGIYHRTKMVALNFRGGELKELWRFDSEQWPAGFRGQGNHNLSVADVDQDGCDEIIYGSMTVDNDGSGLYGTGLGHGDAAHVSDMDPDRPGLEVWQAHEGGPHYGGTYRDAATGEILIQYFGNRDMGRACAGDIRADYPGYEIWGATECPIYSCKGNVLGATNVPVNFMIWWDGDLLREFLDHNWLGSDAGVGIGRISKYNGSDDQTLWTANGTYTTNYTKGNPCLSADILGDWREEVIFRTTDDKNLRIYTSTYPTQHRLYTLMHDPSYRLAIAWQNNSYNQPPHPGYFLGAGMDSVPPPPITGEKLVWNSGGTWDLNSTESWLKGSTPSVFNNGDPLLFDILGGYSDTVIISGNPEPESVSVIAPTDYTFSGTGSISGSAGLLKSGAGTLTIRNLNNFTGYTSVWEGGLMVHGSVSGHVNVKRFASAGGSGHYGKGISFESRSRLIPGEEGSPDTLFITGQMEMADKVEWMVDLSGDSTGSSRPNDLIKINGDLMINGAQILFINQLDDSLQTGTYSLIEYTGSFTGDLSKFSIHGIPGIPWEIFNAGQAIQIRFIQTRQPASLVWEGGIPNNWDLVTSLNWLREGNPDWFVSYDTVLFTDEGIANNTVNLEGDLYAGEVNVDAEGNYKFTGPGTISGSGDLVKSGKGTLSMENTNNYVGATLIHEGVIEIAGLTNAGQAGPLGAGTGLSDNLVLNGGTLRLTGSSSTDRNIGIGAGNGIIDLEGTEFRMHGSLSGEGQLIKTGAGTLIWQVPNTHQGGTLLKEGRIHLRTEEANLHGPGPGILILQDATLSMIDDRNSYTTGCDWKLAVPEGYTGWLNLDSRCSLTGSLEGAGTLNLFIPFIRSYLEGDWSAFTGRINAGTTADGGSFLVGNTAGFPGAHIHLGNYVTAIYDKTSDVIIEIGALTGTPLSRLGAGGEGSSTLTWKIGGMNSDHEFNGIICNDQFKNSGASAAIIKTGTAGWTLTNANTYSGGTTVEAGKLWINNSSGSGTGSGAVTVLSSATLGGTGIIAGPVIVESGGVILPGPNPGSVFTIDSSLWLKPGSFLAVEVNPINKKTRLLKVSGNLNTEGYIYFTNFGDVRFAAGDIFQLADAGSISGELGGILPSSPGEGLRWDTSDWISSGTIRVQLAVGLENHANAWCMNLFPNPAGNLLYIELSEEPQKLVAIIENITGQTMLLMTIPESRDFSLDLSRLPSGWYLLKLDTGNGILMKKFIKTNDNI